MNYRNKNKWENVIVAGKKCKIRYKHIISPKQFNEIAHAEEMIKYLKEEIGKLAFSKEEMTQLTLGFKLGELYKDAREIQYNLGNVLFLTGITVKNTPSLLAEYYDYEFEDGTLIDEDGQMYDPKNKKGK